MSARLDLPNPSILPWQFPQLDLPRPAAAEPQAPPATDEPSIAAPEPPLPEPAADPAAPALEDADRDLEADRATATEHGLEEGRSRGYTEGHAKGLSDGHAEGYARGLAEGKAAAEAALAEQARRLAGFIQQLSAPIPTLENSVEQAVAGLALEVARAVIGDEVGRSREHLVRLIREALARIPIGTGRPRLLLHPSDIELIRSLAPDMEEAGTAFVPDEAIEPGGCIVVADTAGDESIDRRWHKRTGEGVSQVDLTLASRWRTAMHALFEGEDD